MNRKKYISVVILCIFALVLTVVVVVSFKAIRNINFKNNLNGSLYYSTNAGEVVKYNLPSGAKEKLLRLGYYNAINDSYFDKDSSELTVHVTTKDTNKLLIICMPASEGTTYKVPSVTEDFTVKNGCFYYVENNDGIDALYKTDIKAEKTDLVVKWNDTVTLCKTESSRLYFNKKSDNRFYYFENGKEVQCPANVRQIIAANDKAVVSYNPGLSEITVFDAYTWDVISSLNVSEEPKSTAISQKADRIIFCSLNEKDIFAGNTDSYTNYKIVDLLTGKTYNYKTDKNERIMRFFGWEDTE